MLKQKRNLFVIRAAIIAFGSLILLLLFFSFRNRNTQRTKTTLTIAMIQNTRISNLDSNYYKKWLEEQAGYQIQFEYIPEGYEKEYLSAMLTSSHNTVDAVFLPEKQDVLTEEEFEAYVSDGYILDITQYIEADSNLAVTIEKYSTNRAESHYFPNIDTSRKAQNMQVLWFNIGWLKNLNLPVPRTSEELVTVLQAFREQDPNQNDIQDELPLISCEEDISLCSYYYLINAFTYYNPNTSGVYRNEHNDIVYAPTGDSFRAGLEYVHNLYQSEVLSDVCFHFTKRQLMEFVNAPQDLVGAFTSRSIADVVYPNCSDILARYIQVAPLTTKECEGNAVKMDYQWNIGGFIPSNSRHPEEAFELMDLMLSEEASLIAEFGEEGVDWKYSEEGDLSTYGSKAKITTLQYLEERVQNKNFAGMGPHVLSEEYANGVTWNGNNSLVEYIDARAVKSYEPYYIVNSDSKYSDNIASMAYQKHLQEYTDKMILDFVTGKQSVNDDDVWESFCENYMERIREDYERQ